LRSLFTVTLTNSPNFLINQEVWGVGQGNSKQRAQQAAASMALKKIAEGKQ